MTANTKTYTSPIDLYRQGVAVLTDHLGPVDSVRFLRLLDKGSGDYTTTRQSQPDEGTMEELCAEIRAFEETLPKT
ncbi:MAG: hypothetical protein MUF04_00475 [Akkermansiaceae bacterium]|jgi:hypothetical protein|nr:hypothetical protein [Akkermansiaceae bacterium]